MSTPKYTIKKHVQVGIYDSHYVARVYADKIIVVSPYVKWVGNTGCYAESKKSIRDQKTVDRVSQELTDDCEDTAWGIIGRSISDDWLSMADY